VFVLTRESFLTDTLFPVKDMWTTIRLVMKVTILKDKGSYKGHCECRRIRFDSIQNSLWRGG